ncbi:MAG: hypothetical protein ABIW76_14505 [Fibrobacteria bacterium]
MLRVSIFRYFPTIPFFCTIRFFAAIPFFAGLALFYACPVFPESQSVFTVRKAVFSDRQLFWPQLEGQGRPAFPRSQSARVPQAGSEPRAAGVRETSSAARIAVLPVTLKDFHESLPCDSCHRLSANGMEFFLENYLKDRLQARFPGFGVDLIAPNHPLLETRLPLIAYLDSLDFPWSQWFPDSSESLIYRPRDRFMKPATRKRLDRLGGMLGASHLLLPCRMYVKATPKSSITHQGGLDWGFSLVFWNVAAGSPEWAIRFSDQEGNMNLDEALDGRMDKSLGNAWDGLPAELGSLWAAEPH